MNKINEFIQHWSERKSINGKSFDELFNIEGMPLWWFYKRYFVFSHYYVMPKPLNTFDFIKNKRNLKLIDKLKFYFASKILRRYILKNENKKIECASRNKKYSKEKKILFLTYTNHLLPENKIFRVQNIIGKIRKDRKVKDFVLFADPLSGKNYKKIAKLNTIYSYYDEDISKKAKNIADELSRKFKGIDEKTKYKMLSKDGSSLWPYLKYAFDFFFSREFIYLTALYYNIFKKIFERENINAIVLTAQNGLFEKCALAATEKMNVKSILIQHGIALGFFKEDLNYFTKIAVFGDSYKKMLMKNGLKKDNIFVSGPVIFDDIVKYKKIRRKKWKKEILVVTSPIIEDLTLEKRDYFKKMKKVLKDIYKIKDVKVTIKLHPREKHVGGYRKIMKNIGYKEFIVIKDITRDNFYKRIAKSDIFVNFGSTAAIEAMILDKPIININMGSLKKEDLIRDSDAVLNISYREDVKKAIEKSLKRRKEFRAKIKKFVGRYCHKTDGKAYERVVELIYSYC